MRPNKYTDIFFGGALLMLAMLGIFVAIPEGIVSPSNIDSRAVDPQFWPKIILIGLALAGAVIFIQGLFKYRIPSGQPLPQNTKNNQEQKILIESEYLPVFIATLKVGIATVGLFAYYFATNILGMIIASSGTIIFFTLLGGEKRLKIIFPLAFLLPTGLYYFFVYVADIPIPLGIFEALR